MLQRLCRAPRYRHACTVLLAGCFVLPSGLVHAAGCGPAPAGPPASCTASAPASIASDAPGTGAGNPINVITGNKYQREEDMPALPGVLGLEIVRHYNSAYSKPGAPNGPMGREWKLSYETELFDKFGRIQILQADGGRVIFERDPKHPNLCGTRLPANGRLTLTPNARGAQSYVWTWPNGRRLFFNATGKLDRIAAPTGETVTLTYDTDNVLIRVSDPQGRGLTLGYYGRAPSGGPERFLGVHTIDSPVGRFVYEYGSAVPPGSQPFDARMLLANLVRVRLPTGYDPARYAHPLTSRGATSSGVSRIYHHDDPRFPWLLTGIGIETMVENKPVATRVATYGYDANGLANLSTHANDAGKVTLEHANGGKTVLTNSLGQQTVYRHAIVGGEFRLLEVRGAGCATCGETNVRYGYDKLGQWVETTQLDDHGNPVGATRRQLDPLGRIVAVGKVAYLNGQPGPLQWQRRFEYAGDHSAPTLIARPSVAPGREVQTRIAYNSAGQPLSVTETGWIPTYDGSRAAAPITRATSYRYAAINGKSLLTRIDGPLPNGPSDSPRDSDVTIFEYDKRPDAATDKNIAAEPGKLAPYDEREGSRRGLLTRIIAPGDLSTDVLERDEALRPTRLRTTDGDRVQLATIGYHWRGAPADIEVPAGSLRRHWHYDFDPDGRITAVTRPGNLRSTFQYDQAGRASRVILPDGSGLALEHDTENHITGMARYRDMLPAMAEALSATRFDYDRALDRPARLIKVADTLGPLNHYRYNDAGQITAITNALGTGTAFDYGADGRLAGRTGAAGSFDAAMLRLAYDHAGHIIDITAPNDIKTLRRYDDFGGKVFEADPDRGVTLLRHDAAGRLVARIDETGAATRYTFDHAGRLLAVGKDASPKLLQYRYRGGKLVHMVGTPDGNPAHATEKVDYEYDALGQLIKESRWIADAGRTGTTTGLLFVTRHEYDQAGRPARLTLPDGHSLRYRYAPAEPPARQHPDPRHRPGQLEAILFDDQVIVTDIAQTIAGGLTGYTMANGARQHIDLDRRGRIAQLRTLAADAALPAGIWARLMAWFSPGAPPATLYHQSNVYDEAGRLTRMERKLASTDGAAPPAQLENYAYDRLDRLTGIGAGDAAAIRFRYDLGGNRIAETITPPSAGTGMAPRTDGFDERRFHYARGANRLLAATRASPDGAPIDLRGAWFYHSTGLPLARLQWNAGGTSSRRTVHNSDRRPIAVYDNDRLVARYRYNSQGERIAKTMYPARPALTPVALANGAAQGDTSYALYRDQRLAAETDSRGRITAHYVYLYGKPVAKIEMADNSAFLHRLWKTVTLRTVDDASDRLARIYPITTDHLGTPQQVMDEHRQVVWQAVTAPFGQAQVTYAAQQANGQPFQMQLRLPGQVYDAETGLHYNYLRDYDPALGRYTTPDPARPGMGNNPYLYAANNPLTKLDPLGLYEEDIHYYMTYFLARVAGVDAQLAYIIATAAQYIDDNPDTRPLDPNYLSAAGDLVFRGDEAAHRLATYHFTQLPQDDVSTDPATRFANPGNAQLVRLFDASLKAGEVGTVCAKAQMYGEYLHAFEDTFSHRSADNIPISVAGGWGHATSGHLPDYTYNTDLRPIDTATGATLDGPYWPNNEARTLQMEHEVFDRLSSTWADGKSPARTWEDIEPLLKKFNATRENSGNTHEFDSSIPEYTKKIDMLNQQLNAWGYRFIGSDGKEVNPNLKIEGNGQYNSVDGSTNRGDFLRYRKDENGHKAGARFQQNDFKGTILK